MTHICVSKLSIISSDNGLSPGRRQAIIWTNAGIFLIGHLGTNFSEILIEIQTLSFTKMRLKTSSAEWRPFRPQCVNNYCWCQSVVCIYTILTLTDSEFFIMFIINEKSVATYWTTIIYCDIDLYSFPLFNWIAIKCVSLIDWAW